MAAYCYLVWEEGILICTVQHRNSKNCDLYKNVGKEVANA
jgi:hypothetical protein